MEQKQAQTAAPAPKASPFDERTLAMRKGGSIETLSKLFDNETVQKRIAKVAPAYMRPERMIKVMLSAVNKTPKLLDCSQWSLLQALIRCSEMGLEPGGGAYAQVHLIPFGAEVQVIPDYKGLTKLVRLDQNVEDVYSMVVYERDKFRYRIEGYDKRLKHTPVIRGERGAPFLFYSVVKYKSGGGHIELMHLDEILKVRDTSNSWKRKPNSGPWHDWFEEMAKKTVFKRLCKWVETSPELRKALNEDDDVIEGTVTKRDGDIVAGALARRTQAPIEVQGEVVPFPAATAEPVHDAVTGEVVEAPPLTVDDQVPSDPIDKLLWRIARANAPELGAITRDVGKMSKEEPRRLEVARAIGAREKELRAAEGGAK